MSSRRRNSNINKSFEEFCACTSIHGVQYLGERGIPLGERLCWIIILTIGFLISSSLISNEFYKWKNSHVIITYNDTFTSVWEIPFPAITVCSDNKYRKEYAEFFMQNESEVNNDNTTLEILEAAMVTNLYGLIKPISKFRDDSFLDKIKMVAPPLTSVIQGCTWTGYGLKYCNKLAFKPIFTDSGLCFTFNSLEPSKIYNFNVQRSDSGENYNSSDWTLEHGYSSSSDYSKSYPYRGGSTLEIYLIGNDYPIDNWTRNPYQGFEVLINNPAEVPQSGDNFISIRPNSDVVVSVKPQRMEAGDDLRKKYSPAQRHCYYPSERPLAYFKTYVQRNCKLECLTNYTLYICDCVHFFMPRKLETKICGSESALCAISAAEKLKLDSILNNNGDLCNCLPDCNYLQYSYEIIEADSEWAELLKILDPEYKLDGDFLSSVKIQFYSDLFIAKYRKETYVFSDFLANCGGLLGLFSGFSIISIVEFLYHIILRFRRNRNAHKTEGKETEKRENIFHLA